MNKENDSCISGCAGCSGCGHEHDELEMLENISPVITLTDDDGNDVKFEILDVVVMDDEKEYLVLSEVKEKATEDVEVVILEIKEENGEEVYDTVTDEKIGEAVFNKFVEQQKELDESIEDEDK